MKFVSSAISRRPHGRAAFTLVEQVIGMGIVAVTFVSLFASFSSGFALVELARENLRATQILQEKTETLRLYTMEQIETPGFIPLTFTEQFYPAGTNAGVVYHGTLTLAAPPFTANYTTNLKLATFELTWTSGNVLRRRSMSTLIARNGLQNYIY
jgi:type II secretory pathway pseudopilin PulG